MSRGKQKTIKIPPHWWKKLAAECKAKGHRDYADLCTKKPGIITAKTIRNAEIAGEMKLASFRQFAALLEFESAEKLEEAWGTAAEAPDLSIASVDDVLAWGWDGRQLLDALISLDHETIEGMTDIDEGRTEQWAPVFMDHPETWRLITDGPGSIAGYWHFVPLFEEEFARAKDGLLNDSEVTTDKVRLFELPGEYDMYVTIFCLKPRFRRPLAVTKLFDSFLDMLTLLARQGVFFREICANAYSANGVKLCRHFGMAPHKDHSSRGVIYTRRFYPFPPQDIFTRHPDLGAVYTSHFGAA